MLTRTQDDEQLIERVAALDIGKAELMCCARVPDEDHPGKRMQEVQAYSTMTRSLLGMSDHLASLGVTRVVMEATSDYWKPVFYLLEAAGFETWLVNAKDVKHLPGRPKTDCEDHAVPPRVVSLTRRPTGLRECLELDPSAANRGGACCRRAGGRVPIGALPY